jgi:hypothetical protein
MARTPTPAEYIAQWKQDIEDSINHEGRHEGHTLGQAGRYIYCSCGLRLGQGRLRDLEQS